MWIVRLALRRPYTFVVLALLLVVMGVQVVRQTPTDILPAIDVPVISVVWTYNGLPAQQVEQQITQFSEYSLAGNVSGVQRIESTSFDGVSAVERRRRGLAAERVDDGWAEFLPTLSAVLTPAVQSPTTATIPSPSFVGLLLLSVPLFDGGARYGRLDEREAVLHAAEATLEDARLRARSEVRAAHASLLHRARAREAAARSAELAEETRRLVLRTFDEGTGTQLELIDAERAARDAATGRVLAEVAERSAVLDLLAAAGVFPDAEVRP